MEYHVLTITNLMLRFIEAFVHTIFVVVLLNKKIPVKKYIFFSVMLGGIYECIHIFSPHYLSGIVTVLIFIPALKILLKEKWHVIICAYLITALTVGIVDFIVSCVLMVIFNFETFTQIVSNQKIYAGGTFAVSLIVAIIAGYIHYTKLIKNNTRKLENTKNFGIMINYVVMFTLLIPNIIILIYYHDRRSLPFEYLFINMCSIVILFFINMYNTNNNIKLTKIEQDLIAQQKYSKTQQDLIDGLRTFKHDYSNTLQTMNGYLQFNKIDKLKEMFGQVLDETKAITTLDSLNPNKIKNPGVFGILNGKYQKAKENKLKMQIEVLGNIEGVDIEIFDLTRILGILLDNAIEAAKDSKKKRIMFSLMERKNDIIIEITNTFSETKIDFKKIKEKGVSSKGTNRGLGLYKVDEIVNKYESMENTTKIEKDTFIQILKIIKTLN